MSIRRVLALFLGLFIFFYLPVVSGYAKVLKKWTPEEVSKFIEGVVRYWLELISRVLTELARVFEEQLRQGAPRACLASLTYLQHPHISFSMPSLKKLPE